MAGGIDYPRLIFFLECYLKPKKDLFFIGLGLMIILQIYNNDWLEIVVYTERTGTIEIEFVAKKIFFFANFFSNFFMLRVFFFLRSDGKIEKKIKEQKNCFFFLLEKFEIFLRCNFFLVTTFKFGLFSSFFIGSAAKTTNSILFKFFKIFA